MTVCANCQATLSIGDWPLCDGDPASHVRVMRRFNMPAVAASERSVVYWHPASGQIRYPGRADAPMPDRYERDGYVRRQFNSLPELRAFEAEHGVVAEHASCNSGSELTPEEPTLTSQLEVHKENERQLYREVGLSHLIGPDGQIQSTPATVEDFS